MMRNAKNFENAQGLACDYMLAVIIRVSTDKNKDIHTKHEK